VPAEHAQAVEDFVLQYQRVAGQLRALIYRALCPQLIKFNVVRVHGALYSTHVGTHSVSRIHYTDLGADHGLLVGQQEDALGGARLGAAPGRQLPRGTCTVVWTHCIAV
jgi:hypothetical protein